MLLLILQRVQNTTESALSNLVHRIEHLKISEIEGENVETVATLVKAALTLVDRASERNMVRLPFDFPKTLLKVYQTSSVPEFNAQFQQMLLKAQQSQDLHGGTALWPSIEVINTLAKNTYIRMLSENTWTVPASTKAYHARRGKGKGKRTKAGGYSASTAPSASSTPSHSPVCWNCEGPHHSADCPQPRNQTLFESNKAKWQAAREARRRGSNSGRPHRKFVDGKPMIRNKQGVYVLDNGTLHKTAKAKALLDDFTISLASLDADDTATTQVSALTGITPNLSTTPTAALSDRATKTRTLVQATFDKFLKL
jgi:hypothetical protein